MTKTLRVSEPSELLSLIPYQLGFVPSNSVVVVSLRGPRKRVGLVARVDLDDLVGPHKEHCAAELITHAIADEASALVLIGYSRVEKSQPDTNESSSGTSSLYLLHDAMGYLSTMAADSPPVVECWVVSDEQFGHFNVDGHCVRNGHDIYSSGFAELIHRVTPSEPEAYADHLVVPPEEAHAAFNQMAHLHTETGILEEWPTIELCQEHAYPIELLAHTKVAAHMVFEGHSADRSRDRLAKIAAAPEMERAQVREAYEECLLERTTASDSRWQDEALEIWLNAIHPIKPVSPNLTQVGVLTCALEHIPVRDAILISCTSLGARGAREFLAQYLDAKPEQRIVDGLARRAIGEITDPKTAQRPDIEHVETTRSVLNRLISLTPCERHIPARTLLALLAWWQGNLTLAQRHLEEAELQRGTYGLADLVASAVEYGLAPGWRRKQNAT